MWSLIHTGWSDASQQVIRQLEGLLSPRASGMSRQAPSLAVSRATRLQPHKAKKHHIIESIVSQNARGLKTDDRVQDLLSTLERRKIFAACIQETWRTGRTTLELKQSRLFLAGLEPNQVRSRRGEQGVGIALSQNAVAAWKAAGSILHDDLGARILAVRLLVRDDRKKEVGIFLVSAYAPIGCADQSHWDDFMEKPDNCIARKLKDDIFVIGADTNSSLGIANNQNNQDASNQKNSLGNFGLPHVNNAGLRFNSYLETNSMVALTTCYQKRSYGTWIHPRSKLPHQIDHFITSKSEFCRFTDAGVTEPIMDSDHRAVMCKLRISARLKKRSTPREKLSKLDSSALSKTDVRDAFCKEVLHNYNNNTANDVTKPYTKLAVAMNNAAHAVLPKKTKAQFWQTNSTETQDPQRCKSERHEKN